MTEQSYALELRKLVPGLPATLTREAIDRMSPDQQAALLRSMDAGIKNVSTEHIRAEGRAQQHETEAKRIQAEVETDHGVSSLEDLERLVAEASEASASAWAEVETLLNG